MKKMFAAVGLAAALGIPAAVYATGSTESVKQQQTEEIITCPLTGEQIPACCCPLNDDE
ncbi:MAG: hypothetical protein M9894_09670 [Planctomycetes bacterium]|nr:hypothetical protein [Planctomycetota bacterium]